MTFYSRWLHMHRHQLRIMHNTKASTLLQTPGMRILVNEESDAPLDSFVSHSCDRVDCLFVLLYDPLTANTKTWPLLLNALLSRVPTCQSCAIRPRLIRA